MNGMRKTQANTKAAQTEMVQWNRKKEIYDKSKIGKVESLLYVTSLMCRQSNIQNKNFSSIYLVLRRVRDFFFFFFISNEFLVLIPASYTMIIQFIVVVIFFLFLVKQHHKAKQSKAEHSKTK